MKYGTIPTMEQLALPDTDRLRALSAGLFVSRGRGAHPTRTIDSWELIWLVRGELCLFEEERRFDLRAGDALILWPDRRHGAAAPYVPECSFYWVHFRFEPDSSGAAIPRHVRVARPDRLTALFRQYLNDQETGELSPAQAALLIQLMLHEAGRPPRASADDRPAAALARLARQYLLENIDGDVSTAAIARVLGCNADYLGRCFRSVYRETITDAIQKERLTRARALLLDGNESVDRIARACGFRSPAFFRRVFHRAIGLSPTRYRAMHARVRLNTE